MRPPAGDRAADDRTQRIPRDRPGEISVASDVARDARHDRRGDERVRSVEPDAETDEGETADLVGREKVTPRAFSHASGLGNPIGAATGARKNVREALDTDVLAQHAFKKRDLFATKTGAHTGRRANRAMVLDQQQVARIGIAADLRHIAFALANPCQRINASLERALVCE